jgi:hypothetical protein
MILSLPLLASLAACASFPPPSERLVQAESGVRAAQETGAANEPAAALHLKMANDQIAEARKLIADGQNERADAVLLRAQSDAELSLQLTKEARSHADAAAALSKIGGLQAGSRGGAR